MELHRVTAGATSRQALGGVALLATFLVCLWAGTYRELVPVGLIGAWVTPIWAVPLAVAVGVGGTLLAFLIYRHGRPADRRGRLLLWGLLSALLMDLGSPGPWLRLRFTEHAELQHGLVLVAAVVGAVLLVVLRRRRSAGMAVLFAGLVGLGVTLNAATHPGGLLLFGPYAPTAFEAISWELELALLASVSLALCGLAWLLALVDSPKRARVANAPTAAS